MKSPNFAAYLLEKKNDKKRRRAVFLNCLCPVKVHMLAMILRGVLYTERAGYFIDFEAVWVRKFSNISQNST